MTHPPQIRETARRLRRERDLTVDELAERLALPRTTVYGWVRDIPLQRARISRFPRSGQALGSRAMQANYRRARDAAYEEGRGTFRQRADEPGFRDFVCLYLAEGSKRDRNRVSVCNSDPAIVRLCDAWLRRLSSKRLVYSIQYHADQDLEVLRAFWSVELGIDGAGIRMQRKSNSNQLTGRTWRCEHGVLAVTVNDTLLRARIGGWMDSLRESWP